MIFNSLLKSIDRGKAGLNTGIPMGLDRFSNIVPNIQKSKYHIIVGESGSGKSAFVDTAYVFNPLEWYMHNKADTNIKLKIFYYSFEISKDRLLTKQIARKLFVDHGLLLDVNYILSYGKNRISEEHFQLVTRYADYFNQMEEFLVIKDNDGGSFNPTGIRNDLWKWAEQNGKTERIDNQLVYTENDENLYTIVIVDHLSLVPKERGFNTKENIDKLSEYTILMRNKLKFSFAYLAQANRNINDVERLKLEGNNLGLKMSDVKDSGNPVQDSDTVIGIINPWKYEIPKYRGYDLTKLKGRQRFLNIVKNRDGEADGSLGMLFVGECGYFRELPRKEEITEEYYKKVERLG